MGIDLKGLEKGLGLANDEALKAYIEARQKQLDSDGENTTSIVNKLEEIAELLRQQLDGAPIGDHSTGGHNAPLGADSPSHGGHSLPRAIEENTHATRQLIDRMDRQTMQHPSGAPRSIRTPETVR